MRQARIAIGLLLAAILLLASGPGFRSREQHKGRQQQADPDAYLPHKVISLPPSKIDLRAASITRSL